MYEYWLIGFQKGLSAFHYHYLCMSVSDTKQLKRKTDIKHFWFYNIYETADYKR